MIDSSIGNTWIRTLEDKEEDKEEEEEDVGQGRVFNYEDGDGQPDKPLMLIRSYTGLQH